jgi:hypothetical protein
MLVVRQDRQRSQLEVAPAGGLTFLVTGFEDSTARGESLNHEPVDTWHTAGRPHNVWPDSPGRVEQIVAAR